MMAPFVKRPLPRAAVACYECRMTQMLPGGLTDDTPMANPLNCSKLPCWRTLSLRCSFSYHLVMTPQFAAGEWAWWFGASNHDWPNSPPFPLSVIEGEAAGHA